MVGADLSRDSVSEETFSRQQPPSADLPEVLSVSIGR
jgi:hypothetical protein